VPFILTGVRQGVALGLIGAIIGELFAGSEGIGYMISYAGQMFQTDTLLVGVVIVMMAGMVLTSVSERVRRHFERWRPDHVGGR
jgi:NitT/TauT family transport system permease protein